MVLAGKWLAPLAVLLWCPNVRFGGKVAAPSRFAASLRCPRACFVGVRIRLRRNASPYCGLLCCPRAWFVGVRMRGRPARYNFHAFDARVRVARARVSWAYVMSMNARLLVGAREVVATGMGPGMVIFLLRG